MIKPRYTARGRQILEDDRIIAEVILDVQPEEQAGIIASKLNGYEADEHLLESISLAISDRSN